MLLITGEVAEKNHTLENQRSKKTKQEKNISFLG